MHHGKYPDWGIAAIHAKYYTGEFPTERSEDDPNQGWGESFEHMGDLGGSMNESCLPFHTVYEVLPKLTRQQEMELLVVTEPTEEDLKR